MSSFNRSLLITGPGRFTTSYPSGTAVTFFSKDNVEIKPEHSTVRIGALGAGDEERSSDILHKVAVTPEGRWSANIIAALWPHLNRLPMEALMNNTDRTLAAIGTDGNGDTLTSVCLTKMPNLKFSAVQSLIGQAEFTGLLGNNMDWDDAGNRITQTTGGTFTDSATPWTNALIKTQGYTGALAGITGFSSIDTIDGFDVQFNLRLHKIETNKLGTYQMCFAGLDMAVNFIPANISQADILAATTIGAHARGTALRSRTNGTGAFTITGDDGIVYLTIPSATVKSAATRYGVGDNYTRAGEISVVANRTFSTGAQVALCTLAAV